MKIRVKGVVYDATNIVDAPINLLLELHKQTGMEGQDILDGMRDGVEQLGSARSPSPKVLMAFAALVWIGKRKAGENIGFEEAVEGLSMLDIEPIADVPPPASMAPEAAPDPTQPGSVPATVVVAQEPAQVVVSSPSPSELLPPPSPSTASPSSTSSPA